MLKLNRSLAISLALAFAMMGTLLAQINTGTITGRIADPSGGAISGAKVAASNVLTGQTRTIMSNAEGYYAFTQLPVGRYMVRAEATGFKAAVRKDLALSAGQNVSLNIALEIGAITQTVTVSGAPPALNTTNPAQISTIGSAEVSRLPLAKQDWTGLLSLNNGVTKGGQNGVSMNGLAPGSMNITVDGTNATPDPEISTLGFYQGFNTINIINSDAISQITITKGIAPASSGAGMEGNINIITRSGTNNFHGSLFEINDNSAFDARNPFLTSKPHSNFNEFGGSFGGPILRNRLFFFGNYEGVRQNSFALVVDTVPTPQFLDEVAAKAPQYLPTLKLYPAPNQPYDLGSDTGVYEAAGSRKETDGNGVARLDYYMSAGNLLTLRYTRSRPTQFVPRSITINNRKYIGHNDVYNAQYTHSGSFWTAATRFGYNRLLMNRLDLGYSANLPEIIVSGMDTIGAEDFEIRGGIYTVQEDIAISRGKHTFEFGGVWQRNGDGRIDDTTTIYQYSSDDDFFSNTPSLLGISFPLSSFALHTYQFGGYAQDAYRVTPTLTLNLGVRYDYFTVPKERDNRIFTRNPTALGPGTGSLRPPDQMYKSSWPNFSPRIGFAWTANAKTVVRGGFGMFFNSHSIYGGPIDDVLDSPYVPFYLQLDRSQGLEQGLKFPVDKQVLQQKLIAEQAPVATTAIKNDFPNPYSMQWMVDVQQNLGAGFVSDIAYVATRGLHLNLGEYANLPDRLTGVVPAPAFGQFFYYQAGERDNYNALQTSLNRQFMNGLLLGVNYTWSRSLSYNDGDIAFINPPQDNNNLRAEYGPSPYDIPNNFNAHLVYVPPFDKWAGFTGNGGKMLLGGWQVSGIFTAASGSPVNVHNGNSSYPADRPDRVAGVNPYLPNYSQTRTYLSPAAVAMIPLSQVSGAQIAPGNLGRNAFRTPGQWNLDFSLAKTVPIRENLHFQMKADFLNGLNHVNLGGLQTNLAQSNFGTFTSAVSRSIQIGGKLTF